MPQLLLFWVCIFALTSTSYARNDRDRAAQSFQNQMDNLDRGGNDNSQDDYNLDQNGQNGGNFGNDDQDNQQGLNNNDFDGGNGQSDYNDSNNQSGYQDQHTSLEGPHVALEQELKALKEDMGSVMLRLDRLERKLKANDQKNADHRQKATQNKKTLHKKKMAAKPATKKTKHKKLKS